MKSYKSITIVGIIILVILSTTVFVSSQKNLPKPTSISNKIGDNKTIELNGKVKKLTATTKDFNKNKIEYYEDDEKNLYRFDEKKRLVLFSKSRNEAPIKKLIFSNSPTTNDLKQIVEQFLSSQNININDYIFDGIKELHDDNVKIYRFTFIKNIQGYQSSDIVKVTLNEQGDILSFNAPNIELFKDKIIPIISEDSWRKVLNEEVKKYRIEDNQYEILSKVLHFDNEKFIVNVTFKGTDPDGHSICNMISIPIE